MKAKKYMALAALALPLAAVAQQSVIDFESEAGYTGVGVFDTWENSPFRTGELTGNAKVIDNPYKEVDDIIGEVNSSDKVLAFQRSRWGSNTFGVRVDLATPIKLSQKTQYVHVKIHKPKDGRVMLFALGSRDDRPWQSKQVVQVEASTLSAVKTDKWYDAVFAVTGASGVSVYSLVIATDVESTHSMDEDYVAYIDDIEVNNSTTPRVQYGAYPISVEKTTALTRTDRYTSNIKLTSPSGGAQTIDVSQQSDKLVYQDALAKQFQAKPGETVSASLGFNLASSQNVWMHSYFYLDRNQNGKFDTELNDDGTPAEGSDVMSYSYYSGKNSTGATAAQNPTLAAPDFTIPSDLKPGFYRLRGKVDWDCIDPAGNASSANPITQNGGVIIDTRLNVHGDEVEISRGQNAEGTNGEILNEDGSAFQTKKIPFGQPFTIKVKPAAQFTFSHIVLRHGYLSNDSLLFETPQYEDVTIPAYLFKDNTFTIPAKYIDGDVLITPYFPTDSGDSGDDEEVYKRNFTDELAVTRTDRKLNSLTFTGSQTTASQKVTVPALSTNYVYRDLTNSSVVTLAPGETVNTAIDYTGRAMHMYLYIDLANDGHFTSSVGANGVPDLSSDLISYTYYKNYSSEGKYYSAGGADASLWQKLPAFSLPEMLSDGIYRARLKVDWDNIDPAGHYNVDEGNKINENGGQIVDFLILVQSGKGKLDVQTVNGSVVGESNTGLPAAISPKSGFTLLPVGAADGYKASEMLIRHGANLDGDQYDKNGNRQWSEFAVDASQAYALPADSVYGDVRVTCEFDGTNAEYKLKFGEEFNSEDGSQPNSKYWSRSGWATPTWKRFCAQTSAGQKLTGWIEDGKLVLRCLANPYDAEVNANTKQKLDMISGAVETANKMTFTYGKVEGRLMTIGHTGNFPAFWMMPNNSTYGGWPYSGEIDIWEQIDAQTTTHHTIHTKWANTKADGSECQGQTNNPKKTGNGTASLENYHTFGLEWTENLLTWYVDGKQVFSYAKSSKQSDLDLGQWPFDKPFYIILNQSVGNGSWAKAADTSFTYETKFDWVRVYQKDAGAGIDAVAADSRLDYYVSPGRIRLVAVDSTPVTIVDIAGRTIYSDTLQGNKTVTLEHGAYVLNGEKVVVP